MNIRYSKLEFVTIYYYVLKKEKPVGWDILGYNCFLYKIERKLYIYRNCNYAVEKETKGWRRKGRGRETIPEDIKKGHLYGEM